MFDQIKPDVYFPATAMGSIEVIISSVMCKKNKINYKKLNYFYNKDYENNNILNSIFYGEEVINGSIIISYSDILFEPNVLVSIQSEPALRYDLWISFIHSGFENDSPSLNPSLPSGKSSDFGSNF
mgnify:CR=1 FL=1